MTFMVFEKKLPGTIFRTGLFCLEFDLCHLDLCRVFFILIYTVYNSS